MILEKVTKLCNENKISIAKLEKESGIGNGTINRWDESEPSLKSLKKLADYFSKPIEYFLE